MFTYDDLYTPPKIEFKISLKGYTSIKFFTLFWFRYAYNFGVMLWIRFPRVFITLPKQENWEGIE